MLRKVVDEGAADAEFPSRQRHRDLALGADLLEAILEQAGDMRGSLGAPIVTTARLRHVVGGGEHRGAAEAVADKDGRRLPRAPQAAAAATRSPTLEEKVVLANSPSLEPSPVKSKRSTAMSSAVSASAMRLAACTSLPQVKQWANSA